MNAFVEWLCADQNHIGRWMFGILLGIVLAEIVQRLAGRGE